jgi:hypothetical protein
VLVSVSRIGGRVECTINVRVLLYHSAAWICIRDSPVGTTGEAGRDCRIVHEARKLIGKIYGIS